MKEQAKTPIIVIVVVLVAALLVFFGSKAFQAGNLDQGQANYTPGKPPWQETDPSKRGPGGPPGGGSLGAAQTPPASGAGVQSQASAAPPMQATEQHAPPGMSAPTLGNGK